MAHLHRDLDSIPYFQGRRRRFHSRPELLLSHSPCTGKANTRGKVRLLRLNQGTVVGILHRDVVSRLSNRVNAAGSATFCLLIGIRYSPVLLPAPGRTGGYKSSLIIVALEVWFGVIVANAIRQGQLLADLPVILSIYCAIPSNVIGCEDVGAFRRRCQKSYW